MPRYITLRPDLYEHLRREALVHDRTIKAQALHWLVIGRAIETSSLCTDAELSSLLERFAPGADARRSRNP